MKKILSFLMFLTVAQLCIVNRSYANAPGKIPLRVLYVGYDPQRPMPEKVTYYSTTQPPITAAYKTRMADFKAFLETRFDKG
jgi:hypothetical protein